MHADSAARIDALAAADHSAPLDAGWTVELHQLDPPMVFRSGAQAERAARGLVERLTDAEKSAELVIHLRDGALAGQFVAAPSRRALS